MSENIFGNRDRSEFSGRKTITISLISLILSLSYSCRTTTDIRDTILNDRNSYYFIDFKEYPAGDRTLPIGIFDSGTGGLAVLNDILSFGLPGDSSGTATGPGNEHGTGNGSEPDNEPGTGNGSGPDNGSGKGATPQKINRKGTLRNESYIFLGDLANMPYGSYALENNSVLLVENVLKDVQFLLGNKYYRSAESHEFMTDKSPVKAIVIACNTATAYALDTVRLFLQEAGLDIGVIGVIDAGSRGALAGFSPGEAGSIAVLATDGTVKSGAYPLAINAVSDKLGYHVDARVFQQAGIGIAEAVDENIYFIDRSAKAPREEYKGPAETGSGEMKIDLSMLGRYRFKMNDGAMLFEGDSLNPHNLQINSVENYISFHLVTLMEKIRNSEKTQPLKSVVLACTHYPFFEETFRQTLLRLRDYNENGEYLYRPYISEDLIIVNPAFIVADQLYRMLEERDLLNRSGMPVSEFYLSVPNVLNKKVDLREDGSFTYEYKYGRRPGEAQEYVKCVPFSRSSVPQDILNRLSDLVPPVYDLIVRFNSENSKTEYLETNERIENE
jgi:glutamate racemase